MFRFMVVLPVVASLSASPTPSVLAPQWWGRVTSVTVRDGERSKFEADIVYNRHVVIGAVQGTDPFAALFAAHHSGAGISSVGVSCEFWTYQSPSHEASFCIGADRLPHEWTLTYRHFAGNRTVETRVFSSLKAVVGGHPPAHIAVAMSGGQPKVRAEVPWQCNCEAYPEYCAGSDFDVAECVALVAVAGEVGFNETSAVGSSSNLLSVDPIATHTVGCYCCWAQGVQCTGKSVMALRWSGRGLGGRIPEGINALKGLLHVELGQNQLHGPIPTLKMTSLEGFYAQGNALTGGFPTGSFPNLWRLYLDSNALTGTLPTGLAVAMPLLRRLGVSGNLFTGEIPADIPFFNNSNAEQRMSSIQCDFWGNSWSCPIESWMRAGPGYACENITCVDTVLV